MRDTEVIVVNTNSYKSIREAERKKARLENAGYNLQRTGGGFIEYKLYYKSKE